MNNAPAINRIGNLLINWDQVEAVQNIDNLSIKIFFKSGKSVEIIEPEKVKKLIDFYEVFPDVLDDETRSYMKSKSMKEQFGTKKTDMDVPVPQRFTDFVESPKQNDINWTKTRDWQKQLRQFKK